MCTHRGHDGWFEDGQGYFGTFSIIRETFDFHHVEIVFSFSSHTHLQQTSTAECAALPPNPNALVIYVFIRFILLGLAECTKWAIEHRTHRKRLCSLVHRCTSINKLGGPLHGEEESVSYCFEWQLLLRIIVFYVNFKLPFVRLERTPLGKTAHARYN